MTERWRWLAAGLSWPATVLTVIAFRIGVVSRIPPWQSIDGPLNYSPLIGLMPLLTLAMGMACVYAFHSAVTHSFGHSRADMLAYYAIGLPASVVMALAPTVYLIGAISCRTDPMGLCSF